MKSFLHSALTIGGFSFGILVLFMLGLFLYVPLLLAALVALVMLNGRPKSLSLTDGEFGVLICVVFIGSLLLADRWLASVERKVKLFDDIAECWRDGDHLTALDILNLNCHKVRTDVQLIDQID